MAKLPSQASNKSYNRGNTGTITMLQNNCSVLLQSYEAQICKCRSITQYLPWLQPSPRRGCPTKKQVNAYWWMSHKNRFTVIFPSGIMLVNPVTEICVPQEFRGSASQPVFAQAQLEPCRSVACCQAGGGAVVEAVWWAGVAAVVVDMMLCGCGVGCVSVWKECKTFGDILGACAVMRRLEGWDKTVNTQSHLLQELLHSKSFSGNFFTRPKSFSTDLHHNLGMAEAQIVSSWLKNKDTRGKDNVLEGNN
ncbi:hypothetical protein Tco_0096777 [Tanacetum coccineum]